MPTQQITDGTPDGAQFPNTKVGFYGATPVAVRASNTLHYTSVVSAYTATSASALIGSWIIEVTNTLTGLGIWV